jgi:hypothetical protein
MIFRSFCKNQFLKLRFAFFFISNFRKIIMFVIMCQKRPLCKLPYNSSFKLVFLTETILTLKNNVFFIYWLIFILFSASDIKKKTCKSLPCLNNGTCVQKLTPGRLYLCVCPSGFKGIKCEISCPKGLTGHK